MFQIKICGVTNIADALAIEAAGADALGMIFCPSPRRIEPEKARGIHQVLGSRILRVGVFRNQTADEIYTVAKYCGLDYIQLHGSEDPEWADGLGIPYIKSLNAGDKLTDNDLAWRESQATAILLDSAGGGTGRTFNWSVLPSYRILKKPLILAGGLNVHNISEALVKLQPDGIDIGSGVEASPGIKDHQKIVEFMAVAQNSYRRIQKGC